MEMRPIYFLLYILKISTCEKNVNKLFDDINRNVVKFNAIGAELEWKSSVSPHSTGLKHRSEDYLKKRIKWQQKTCNKLSVLRNSVMSNVTQQRQSFLLCRGPAYNIDEARFLYNLNDKMVSIYYNVEVCIPRMKFQQQYETNLTLIEKKIVQYLSEVTKPYIKRGVGNGNMVKDDTVCLKQNDLEYLAAHSKNEKVLKWIWLVWREKTGPAIKELFKATVDIENRAAKRNGYTDIGDSWREEMEIKNLRHYCYKIYKSIKPLYTLLHGVVRYFLRKKYGNVVPARGPIPSHLLGNLWMQNWESLSDIIVPNSINIDDGMKTKNWNVKYMVRRTEDFYLSLGLPPMTDTFWSKSVFTDGNNKIRCHGSAADMFNEDDYRLIYCSGISLQDFNVLHHEMGHIHYYMAYSHQPGLFRQANSAFQESIGEAIILGVITPQHLNRLGLINDSTLFITDTENNVATLSKAVPNKIDKHRMNFSITDSIKIERNIVNATTDEIFLLKRALNKLPQIPFSLLVDDYRWKYFEGGIDKDFLNKEFWTMSLEFQGISPPEERNEEFFDIGAIYHVADNTPYIRYYLSSFLQHQLFESYCKVAVLGNQKNREPLPNTIILNRCDIYGTKAIGKNLIKFMSRGNSHNWREILKETLDEDNISPEALLRYYQPLQDFLMRLVNAHDIPIGW